MGLDPLFPAVQEDRAPVIPLSPHAFYAAIRRRAEGRRLPHRGRREIERPARRGEIDLCFPLAPGVRGRSGPPGGGAAHAARRSPSAPPPETAPPAGEDWSVTTGRGVTAEWEGRRP